jgi:hypothetical protein
VAEPQEEVPGAGAPNRTLLWIMGSVAVLFIAAGLLVGVEEEATKPPPIPPANARALVVGTDDASRTVVVAPCATDAADTARSERAGKAVPNTVRFVFPRGSGDRAVLIPDCSPQAGVSGANSGLPSAAFILPVGTKENLLQIPPLRAQSQLIVRVDSKAKTIVLGPCSGLQGGEAGKPVPAKAGGQSQDAILEPEVGQGDLATAPQC